MPSNAFTAFRHNSIDVKRLIESHGKLHAGNPGKKGLGHITRSGVVMLCASWELYAESLLVEAVDFLVNKCQSPAELPLDVQKELARHVRESKHELKALALANDGWRGVLVAHARLWCDGLNTPKAGPLNEMYQKLLGVERLSDYWSCGAVKINDFVGVRGDIAHRGRYADYIKLPELRDYLVLIDQVAVETDNAISGYVKSASPAKKKPWNITA
ncbi:HEPN domain-containing protein [Pseudomonas citronellolis]|uniref:HEPN domain-containing protein n=1 Tax=Pseudomonas citronellolis TaxID=53408 RepID=UPI0023E3F1FF|nr:HEPN domain-containing protein [Pseudomonas citronellolis]MDF3934282.1 HEPN domain-containing protein [Pseudomonas citronellolis]